MEDARDAEDAVRALNATQLDGREIKVEVSTGVRGGGGGGGGARDRDYGGGRDRDYGGRDFGRERDLDRGRDDRYGGRGRDRDVRTVSEL